MFAQCDLTRMHIWLFIPLKHAHSIECMSTKVEGIIMSRVESKVECLKMLKKIRERSRVTCRVLKCPKKWDKKKINAVRRL